MTTELSTPTAVSKQAAGPDAAPAVLRRSPGRLAVRRFRRNKVAVGGALTLVLLALVALCAPLLATHGPTSIDPDAFRSPPSSEHWLGTDQVGRDVFARLLYAGRVSLAVGLVAALVATGIGLVLGAVAGTLGGWVDTVISRSADIVLSFPSLIVVLVVAGVLGPSVTMLVVVIGAFNWPTACRVVRGVTLTLRELEFVQAARAVGAGHLWVITRHIVPAVLGQLAVVGTLLVAQAILAEAVLSFLGLGVQPPRPSWGNMLTDAQNITLIRTMPWFWLPPGLAIALAVLAANFVGDGLRDAVDPRLSGGLK